MNQGWTKDPETLAPLACRRPQEDEPLRIGRHAGRIIGNGRDAFPPVQFDESLAERADLLADPARGLLRRVPEADDELLAFLLVDGIVPDHGHDGFGRYERVLVQHREVVVAEPALLLPARRVAHFAGNDLFVHVGHYGDTVIDGALLQVRRPGLPFDLQIRIVPGGRGIGFQNEHRRVRIRGPFYQPRPLGDFAGPVSPGDDLDALNVLGVLDPQHPCPQVPFTGKLFQRVQERAGFRGVQKTFEVAALLLGHFRKPERFDTRRNRETGGRGSQQVMHEPAGSIQLVRHVRFVGSSDGPQAEQMQRLPGMLLVSRDATQEIERRPRRDAVSAAQSFGFPDGALCILPVRAGQAACHLGSGQTPGFREQARLIHLPRGAVDAVHTGPGVVGIHQQQGCLALGFPTFYGSVRGDGPPLGVVGIGDPKNLPAFGGESVVTGEMGYDVRCQTTHESHSPGFGPVEYPLERAPQ